jgi:ribose/xylose/arabinose/galactoside ABC-type transport system permease subunit
MLALEGMAAVFTNAQTIIELPRGWSWVGATSVAGFSSIVLVAAGVYVVFAIYLGHSVFGRHLYAVGGDKEAARANGISPLRVVTAAYVLSGILAAVAGWLASSRLDSASPSLGSGIIFTVFAAAVVGGISLQGGRGNLWAAAGGVLLLGCVENVLQLAAISPLYINGIRGLVIVAVVLIDVARRRLIGWLGIQEAAA